MLRVQDTNVLKMKNKKINWGITELGKVANRLAHDLQTSDRAKLYTVAPSCAERAKAFKQNYGVGIVHTWNWPRIKM